MIPLILSAMLAALHGVQAPPVAPAPPQQAIGACVVTPVTLTSLRAADPRNHDKQNRHNQLRARGVVGGGRALRPISSCGKCLVVGGAQGVPRGAQRKRVCACVVCGRWVGVRVCVCCVCVGRSDIRIGGDLWRGKHKSTIANNATMCIAAAGMGRRKVHGRGDVGTFHCMLCIPESAADTKNRQWVSSTAALTQKPAAMASPTRRRVRTRA